MTDHLLGFPLWLRINHFVNFLLLTLLIRSGIQILADHPRLYWKLDCRPGTEWLKFTSRAIPLDQTYTSMDDAVNVSPWIALPGGRHNLGLGRHWHFLSVLFWVINGAIYVTLLFTTDNWQRLIPTSWDIIPQAISTFVDYCSLHLPPSGSFHPYDPLQQLSYCAVVFILAPLAILTGAAMSPAFVGSFPLYQRLFGNRQVARSLHFLTMLSFLAFLIVHVTMVVLTGFSANMNHIVLGANAGTDPVATTIGLCAIAAVLLFNVLITCFSISAPRQVQVLTGVVTDNAMRLVFGHARSRQDYKQSQISKYFWINGRPPLHQQEYQNLLWAEFADYQLDVKGLVQTPLKLSLAELRGLPKQSQTTLHNCIQGWSGVAQWGGVRVTTLLAHCKPLDTARYIIFHTFDYDDQGREYYTSLTLEEASYPQTILAYEMNFAPLPVQHGAPLRLRAETKLGFKMAKYIRSIEIVADYKSIGAGFGGYREDTQYYGTVANI